MSGNEIVSRLGIQSWCFRAFKETPGLIKQLKKCGLDRLEICGVHIDLGRNPEQTLKQYTDAGIKISSYGVNSFTKDEDAARRVFDFAVMADFPAISANLRDGGLETVEKLCAEYGKKIAIHNHGRKHALGSVAALEKLFAESSPAVGLCLDTGWMLDSGEDPIAIAEKFKDRLYGIHIKDFVFDRAGKPEDVVSGTGNLDIKKLAALLTNINFTGYITIEYEGDEQNPAPNLIKCVQNIREAFSTLP